jgi:hypothetical protein
MARDVILISFSRTDTVATCGDLLDLVELLQINGQVIRGGRGEGMLLAQDAAAVQSVPVQVEGSLQLVQTAQDGYVR